MRRRCPTLRSRPNLPLQLAVDASKVGVGWVLYQEEEVEGEIRRYFIQFGAKGLNKHQIKYGISKRELYAIVCGLRHCHYHVFGRPIIVHSDHEVDLSHE